MASSGPQGIKRTQGGEGMGEMPSHPYSPRLLSHLACCDEYCFLTLQEAKEKKEQKTEFTVKLTRYADDSKIKVIKEVKNLVEGLSSSSLPSGVVLGCFYRPPQSGAQSLDDVFISIEGMLSCKRFVIACGNFNVDLSDAQKPHTNTFLQFMSSHDLIHHISEPTRISSSTMSILDLFLTSSNTPVISSGVLEACISDHLPIFLTVSWILPKHSAKTIHRRSFKHFDPTSFNDDVARLPWSILNVFDDVDDKLMVFNSLLNDVLSVHAPACQGYPNKEMPCTLDQQICSERDGHKKQVTKEVSFHQKPYRLAAFHYSTKPCGDSTETSQETVFSHPHLQ